MNKKRPNHCSPRSGRPRRGVSAIEFVLVAPAFLFVVAICAEFARMSMLRNLAQNASYESARFIISEGALVQDGIDRANEVLDRLGNVDAQVTIRPIDQDGVEQDEITFETESVRAEVDILMSDNAIFLPGSLYGENRIRAQMTLRTERYRGFFDSALIANQ